MKKLTRRDFIKSALAGAVSAGLLGMSGCSSDTSQTEPHSTAGETEAGIYTPGTYSSTQKTGFATVVVQCTFDKEAITEVTYHVTETSENDYFSQYVTEMEELCEKFVLAQSSTVDAVTGASLCSKAMMQGVENCILQAKGLASAEPAIQEVEKVVYLDDNTWLGEEPETPAEFSEEVTVDVAVLGCGYAGIAAVRSAVEEGASVALLEKSDGLGLQSSAMTIIGSKKWAELWPRDAKFYDLKAFLVSETCRMCSNRNRYDILRRWVEENGEAVDWWLDAVPADQVSWGTQENGNQYDAEAPYIVYSDCYPYSEKFDPQEEHFPCVPGSIQMKPKGAWQHANLDKAMAEGGDRLKIYYQTPGYKLLREEGGRVNGVIGKKSDGSFIKVNVNKAVVLATGGFMSNDLMIRRFLPDLYASRQAAGQVRNFYSTMDAEGNPCNMGDGHRMGAWIGAKMQDYAVSMSHLVAVNGTIGTMPLLWLDKRGRRFLNEDTQGQQFAESVRLQPGQFAYQIFDSTYDDHIIDMPLGHGKYADKPLAVVDEKVDGETIFKADTLDELLEMLDIDAVKASETIQHYNDMCRAGRDTDYDKNPKYMISVEQGPFYAIKYGRGDDLVTMSGLESDEDCHVLDSDLQVIPGLYVAGNVQGGRYAEIYPETAKGMSVALAMTMGRVAGRNAAKEA